MKVRGRGKRERKGEAVATTVVEGLVGYIGVNGTIQSWSDVSTSERAECRFPTEVLDQRSETPPRDLHESK